MDAAGVQQTAYRFCGNYFGRMGDKTVGNDAPTETEAKKFRVLHDRTAGWRCGNPTRKFPTSIRLRFYDEETDSYGYYTEEDTAEEGWKFNKVQSVPV